MGHDQVIEKRSVLLPDLVLLIDHPLLHCVVKSGCSKALKKKKEKKIVNIKIYTNYTYKINTNDISVAIKKSSHMTKIDLYHTNFLWYKLKLSRQIGHI